MLSKLEKDYLIDLLEKGQNIPEDFKYKLFPVEHKEYELAYAGKMRKEDLLADDDGSFPVPLQIEKVFNGEEHPTFNDGWKNLMVFGDNLQFLKTIYNNEESFAYYDWMTIDPLDNDDCRSCVYLPLCGGGCVMNSVKSTGSYHSSGCFKVKGVVEQQVLYLVEKKKQLSASNPITVSN